MIDTIIVAILIICILAYLSNRFFFSGSLCTNTNRIDGKTVIITGITSGVGKYTALELARRGARVILACRDKEEGLKVADWIALETNNLKLEVEEINLADCSSIRNFADRMYKKLNRLDILINNAGLMATPYWKTKDNFEMQIGVNYFAPFLLTNLLLDLLKKTGNSRIINVASILHQVGTIKWDDINSEKNYNPIMAYCQSKLAMVLFTNELARRLKDTTVTAVSVHPGGVRTRITRYTGLSLFRLAPIVIKIGYPIYWTTCKSAFEGAQTTIHCAVDENIPELSGKYFSDCKVKEAAKRAQDPEAEKRLWAMSEKIVKL